MDGEYAKGLRAVLDEIHGLENRVGQSLAKLEHSLGRVRRSVRRERHERQKLSRELRHAERMMRVLSGFHEALTVTSTENQYLNHVCDSLVRSGEYPLAWIGMAEQHSGHVHPVASAGAGKDYLNDIAITWTEGPLGEGPTGRAIRFRHPQVSRRIADDPTFLPWKDKALARHFASSIALPLVHQNQVFGAINLYSREAAAFDDEKVLLLERVAEHVAFGIHSLRSTAMRQEEEARSQRSFMSRIAIAALLETSLEPLTLHRQLEVALEIILAVPWLSIEAKGSIFLVDEKSQTLVLEVQKNLAPALLNLCQRIPFGYCLCGRAAESREIVFAPSLDHQHDVSFPGIKPHGHYCIPILAREKLLGVLNLYVSDGHQSDLEELGFFSTIANTLAGVIERKTIEEEITRLARYDTLTGVFNRRTFQEYLDHELAMAKREGRAIAVLFLDLDRFKQVNDQLGHAAGDELLRQAARRISEAVRETDVVARFGGDEFCVLLTTLSHPEDALGVGRKVVHTLGREFMINGEICGIGASVGIGLYPDHCDSAEELLKHADQALYVVKKGGRNNALVFTPEMAEPAIR